ncbi:metal ABC transporter substrate-binding protein [Fervidobacterium thailandense]|uniref:ABC transporter substrate-binding protein n=1 Tax=Fervidobacterium thailandense TaxID=1008305 RepID=A0A1E3G1U2_9BACT|nr:metal ABC transporter substrate-binding protein [Fervidobacterium thailandense]ODN30152.1 ABC transporter substrate-binding protein [Fervidobacterium thailandense]
MRKIVLFFFLFTLFLSMNTNLLATKRVVCTLNPYFLIVKEISGGKLDVGLLIKPGANPHTFSPTVNDAKMLSSANLIVANGLGVDNAYLKSYRNVLYVGERIPKEFLKSDEVHQDDEHGNINPHVWLYPKFLSKYIVPVIRDELSRIDPSNATLYRRNAERLIGELNKLDKRFSELLNPYRGSVVILEHPSYFYLFEFNGIELLALEEGHGKQPSTEKIKSIIKTAKEKKLLGIFVGPQFNKSAIEVVSKELGRNYYILDPLGYNVSTIVELFENAYKTLERAIKEAK